MSGMGRPKNLGLIVPPSRGPKVLVFDIETTPYLIHAWGLWKTNAIDIDREWYMLCFAYAWYDVLTGELGEVDWVGLPQNKKWRGGSDDDKYVVRRLWKLFDEADIVVGQNSDRFDIRKANERFLIHGMEPPAPYQTVDTVKIYRKNFAGSASLKYMTRKAGVTLKDSTRGWSLWFDCMEGDPDAWEEMRQYNINDVVATAEMYVKLRPWIQLGQPSHPNVGQYIDAEGFVCPVCGNKEKDEGGLGFQRRGFYSSGQGAYKYPKLRCNACKRYSKHYRSVGGSRTVLR